MAGFYVTHTGQKVVPSNIETVKLSLEDIAHHLTKVQRYGGALPLDRYYSVAEHSIHMAEYALRCRVPNRVEIARLCLMHDSSEAYLGDIVSGLKKSLPDYKEIEKRLETQIELKYKLDKKYKKQVKLIDTRILLDEVKGLLPDRLHIFRKSYSGLKPLGVNITGKSSPYKIKDRFLELCGILNIED